MLTYQIYSFDENDGSIQVKFMRDGADFANYKVDVPLNDEGLYISGTELEQHINGLMPTWVIEREDKINAGIPNAADIAALVVPLPEAETVDGEQPTTIGTQTV
jgi:hypothetical protein